LFGSGPSAVAPFIPRRPASRRLPGGRPRGRGAAALLLLAAGAALAAGQAFAESPLLARSHAAPDVAAPAGPANPPLRVLLQEGGTLEPRAWNGPLRLLDGEGREVLILGSGERLRISREGSLLLLERPDAGDPRAASPRRLGLQALLLVPLPPASDPRGGVSPAAAGPEAVPPGGGAITAVIQRFTGPAAPGLVGLGRRAYRGTLLVRPEGSGLMAVNLIPLETYLPSVVGSEMPARWPAAALQAQAVAARTYALAQRKPASLYDLKATVASQAYLGVEAETDSTRAAVATTRGQVLRFGGALIDAVFHSSSGGSTENSGDLWPRQLPYLVSVPDGDDHSPWREWSLRFEPEQLRRAFRETAGVRSIEVLSASSTGRVRRARVIGPAGSLEVSGGELRQRLGLRSTLVRFRFEDPPGGAGTAPALAPPGRLGGITAAAIQAGASQASPSQAGAGLAPGNRRGLSGGPPRSVAGRPLPPPPPPVEGASAGATGPDAPGATGADNAAALTAAFADPLAAASQLGQPPLPALEVVGRGFGHGVGMSQWGAYALALRGKDHAAILRHFYRGAELVPFAGR